MGWGFPQVLSLQPLGPDLLCVAVFSVLAEAGSFLRVLGLVFLKSKGIYASAINTLHT